MDQVKKAGSTEKVWENFASKKNQAAQERRATMDQGKKPGSTAMEGDN